MIVIIGLMVLGIALVVFGVLRDSETIGIPGVAILVIIGIFWAVLTMTNLQCEGLGESYQIEIRHDWVTGCMLPLEDGREIPVNEDSVAFVIRELLK